MKRPPSALWRVHKPPGVSSTSLVDDFRKTHGGNFTLKVSHGGVLDPFAEGLVLLLVGAANRLFEALHEVPKTYVAQVRWGLETDTGDAGGREVRKGDASKLSADRLDAALVPFRGWTAQVPPAQRGVPFAAVHEVVQLPQNITEFLSMPSSTTPSQSLSLSSQISVVAVPGVHVCGCPLTQFDVERMHSPMPQVVSPRPSSTIVLQLSSWPLQSSGTGTVAEQAV